MMKHRRVVVGIGGVGVGVEGGCGVRAAGKVGGRDGGIEAYPEVKLLACHGQASITAFSTSIARKSMTLADRESYIPMRTDACILANFA